MKTHFDPYTDDEGGWIEQAMCGALTSEYYYYTTTNWNDVTCKRCLKQKEKIMNEVSKIEATIIKQMGEFVQFNEKQNQDIYDA